MFDSSESRSATSLLTDVLDGLEARVATIPDREPILAAFAAWIGALGATDTTLQSAALAATERQGASRHYQDVAILGFACARHAWRNEADEQRMRERFLDGLAWMRGRRFFVNGQPPGFESDGIALMGTGVGIASVCSSSEIADTKKWLADIIAASLALAPVSNWDTALLRAAETVVQSVGVDVSKRVSRTVTVEPDLAAALAALGIVALAASDEAAARATILSPSYRTIPLERAAVQAVALRWLMRVGATALPTRATIADVVLLLGAVPHALKRWPWEEKPRTSRAGAVAQKWDIQNEYHVQSLLWALLAPIFPDLEDEEYLRSIGHKHPRVDLAIPSLGLIIEVKFMRGGSQSELADMVGQVSADTGLYLSIPSEFTQIVAFVWDDSRSNDQHAELLSGLRKLRGVTESVVVSRPGRWVLPD
jgi:hypothetical protein